MSTNGSAAAIPANLYRYSDQCTHAAQDAQDFIRAVLSPAITPYLRGAAEKLDGVNVDISAVFARVQVPDDIAKQVASAFYTDRDVRKVGLAFQIAGGHGNLAAPITTPVHSKDDVIRDQLAQYDAGAAAAKQLPWGPQSAGSDSYQRSSYYNDIFAVLEKNADNVEFCRGLLQAGGPEALQKLLTSIGNGQFDGNLKSGALATDVLKKILKNGLSDPTVAAQLQPSLPTMIPEILNYPSAHLLENWQNLLPLITVIVEQLPDPKIVTQLVTNIGNAIPHGQDAPDGSKVPEFSAGDLHKIMPELTALMSAGVAHSLVPPVLPPGQELGGNWAVPYGRQTNNMLAPFLEAMHRADLDQNAQNELLRSMFQGAYLNVAFMPIPGEGVAATAALGALQSYLGSKDPTDTMGLGKVLKDYNANMDVVTMNNLIAATAGHFALISNLVDHGYVRDGQGHTLKLTGGPGDAEIVKKIAARPFDYDVGNQGKGPAKLTVGDLVNDFNQGAGYIDPHTKIYDLVTARE